MQTEIPFKFPSSPEETRRDMLNALPKAMEHYRGILEVTESREVIETVHRLWSRESQLVTGRRSK